MKTRTAKIMGLALGIILFSAQSLMAADVSKSDLARMEKQMAEQDAESKRLAKQAAEITEEVKTLSANIVKYAKVIQNNEDKISSMEKELEQLQRDLKAAEASFTLEDEHLIKTLSALQNLALKPTESLFVQPLTPVEIIRSAMLLRETVPQLEENANRIKAQLDKIEKQKQQVEAQVKKIINQKEQMEQEHAELKSMMKRKSALRNSIENKSEEAKKKVTKLAAQAQDLRDLLDKLEKERQEKLRKEQEAERKRLAEEKRKKKEEEKQRADLIKFKPQSIKEIGENFIKAKGKLPLPARGQIVTRYGEETAKGVTSKGIIVETRPQAQVVAPFDGNVIFAGPFRGYGNVIIIEHGKGYLSLMAGLDTVDCELGQMLLAGEPIGLMPEDDSKLYVEIRKDNHPINPLTWIKS